MNKRKIKKTYAPGTLVTIVGTHYVFMSLGYDVNGGLRSFNGFNIITEKPVHNVSGKARLATKGERYHYWKIIRKIMKI